MEHSIALPQEHLEIPNTNIIAEQHWDDLERFFHENEKTIQKASEISSFSSKAEDVELRAGTLTDTTRVVLDGLMVLSRIHPVLNGTSMNGFHLCFHLLICVPWAQWRSPFSVEL